MVTQVSMAKNTDSNSYKSKNFCNVCDCKVKLVNERMQQQHINGKKHQRKLEILNHKKKQQMYGTAEYFMKHESEIIPKQKFNSPFESTERQNPDKAMKKSDRLIDEKGRVQTDHTKTLTQSDITSYVKETKSSYHHLITEMCPYGIQETLKALDIQSLEYLKQIMNISPRCIKLLDNKRYKPILDRCGDNMITLLKFIFVPGHSLKEGFEIFYNHNIMRVYFADLASMLFGMPFSIRHKIYKLPRKHNINVFCALFKQCDRIADNETYKDAKSKIGIVYDKIEQIYKYNKIALQIENVDISEAQYWINKNYSQRSEFLEDMYLEGRDRWNDTIAKMA